MKTYTFTILEKYSMSIWIGFIQRVKASDYRVLCVGSVLTCEFYKSKKYVDQQNNCEFLDEVRVPGSACMQCRG